MLQSESITPQSVVKFIVGVAAVATVLWLFWYFSTVVVYILVSALLAIMFRPLVDYLASLKIKSWAVSRDAASVVTLFAIWLLFGALFSAILPLVFSKFYQLTSIDMSSVLSSIEEPVAYVQHSIQHLFSLPESNVDLTTSLSKWVGEVVDIRSLNSAVSSVVSLAVSSVITFFSISFITFFFLRDDDLFLAMVESIFPERYGENVSRAINSITYLLSRYFVGLVCESFIIATLISVVLICFGMVAHDAFFIGVVMGVLNVIPYAGPFLGLCFSIFLGVVSPIESSTVVETVVTIAGSILVVKGLDDFILQPTLYSERVKAHPLEIFIVILMSGYVAGIVGMLLAIPSYTVLRVFAKEFFSQFSLVRKLTKEL